MTHETKVSYYKVMSELWLLFSKDRSQEQFSDEWWEEIIRDFERAVEKYSNTPLVDYAWQVTMAFLNEYERVYKRERQKRLSEEVLSGTQGDKETKISQPVSVPEVVGSEESSQVLTAEDWG